MTAGVIKSLSYPNAVLIFLVYCLNVRLFIPVPSAIVSFFLQSICVLFQISLPCLLCHILGSNVCADETRMSLVCVACSFEVISSSTAISISKLFFTSMLYFGGITIT